MRRISIKLGRWLGEYHLSERDLADMAGIPYDAVRKMANGLAETINVTYLAAICSVLELKLTDILVMEEGVEPPVTGKTERILLKREEVRERRKVENAEARNAQTADKRQKPGKSKY